MVTAHQLPQIAVGPFSVVDAPPEEVVQRAVELFLAERHRSVLVYALHVGGLNSRADAAFVDAMSRADLVYADGGSVVSLAKLAGASQIARAPTTDMGWDLLRATSEGLGRPVRVALVGGPAGLAERAATELERPGDVAVVATVHGYQHDWTSVLRGLRALDPDVTVVGLGAPQEMKWCEQHRAELPSGVVLTCGGWFGHIVGDERRAPKLLRRSGVEWIARLVQQPGRLLPRYARGVLSTLALVAPALRQRRATRAESG